MVRRTGDAEPDPVDRDERLGEAIEAYLALVEAGQAPEPSSFAAGYPDLEDDLAAALGGLALVQGLVGESIGPGHRLESGRRVAGYRIVRELGRGGMGIVYEAVHVGLDRPVALKVLGSNAAPDSNGRRRFMNEARTAAGLHHTHIVPVFDVGQVGGLCYFAMQRIEGSGLDRVIKHLRRDRTVAAGSSSQGRNGTGSSPATSPLLHDRSGLNGDVTATWGGLGSIDLGQTHENDDEPTPFIPPRGSHYYRWVANVGRQAAEALAHAHQRGVIHRDVKPSNILVDARGVVWMADFGLARRLADPSQTQLDSLLGTPRYMSPEQARTGPIDGRSDVYSLGATLYELLTLRPPFEGKTAAELIDQIATREPPSPRQFDPRLSRDLETIVLKALHKRVDDRYASATDLADDLERYLNHEPVRARRIGPIGRALRVARRNKLLTAVSLVAVMTVIISSTLAYVRVLDERDEARIARGEVQKVAIKLEMANNESRSALRSQLIQNAEVVRMSAVANRRVKGLDLLKRAAALPSEPGQRSQLRDEALAFLAIRDVEKRPEIPFTDKPQQGLVFGANGQHLATLSEDWTTVRFWDVETRTLIQSHDLTDGLPLPDEPQRGRGPRRLGNGFPPFMSPGARIAAAGDDIAVIHLDGKGIRLFNATTGSNTGNLRLFEPSDTLIGPPPVDPVDREIMSLAASGDGRRLVTVDRAVDRPQDGDFGRLRDSRINRSDIRVHLWDMMNTDAPLRSLYDPKPDVMGRLRPPLIAISPDGATVAVAGLFEAEVNLFTKDGRVRDKIDSQAELTALALGPEGLLAAAGNRAVHLWDLDNLNQTRASLPSLTHNLSNVDQLRFSPDDGALLAVAGRNSSVEIWDVAATVKVATLPLAGEWHGLAMAPGSKLLAVGLPSSLAFWAVVNPAAQTQIAGFPDRLKTLAFAPNGDLAMLDVKGTFRLWSSGLCPATAIPVESVPAWAFTFDAQGHLITLLQDRSDPKNQAMGPPKSHLDRFPWPSRSPIPSVAIPEFRARAGNFRPPVSKMVVTTDKRTLIMIRNQEVLQSRLGSDGTPGPVTRLEFTSADLPDLNRFDSPSGPPRGRANNNSPPGVRGDRPPPLFEWRDVAVSPTGHRIYLLSFPNGELSGWSIQGHQTEKLPWLLSGKFTRMALTADGSTLAVGDRAGVVRLIDPSTGQIRQTLPATGSSDSTPVGSIAFAPNGQQLAVGTSDQVQLWTIGPIQSTPYVRLSGHRGAIQALAYDSDGHRLASGGEDRGVKVWDLNRVSSELEQLGLE